VTGFVEERPFWGKCEGVIQKNVPYFFTTGNLVLGMLALFNVLEGKFGQAVALIFAAAVLDGIDGKIALRLRACSEMGKQLDSLCDLVSFGVVPAAIIYSVSLKQFGPTGLLIALLFPLAGAYRLARFNILFSSTPDFTGLPITISGGALAALALHANFYLTWVAPLYAVLLSLLMISKIRYPAFKKGRQELGPPVFVLFYSGVVTFICFVIFFREAVLYLLLSYIAFGPLGWIYARVKNGEGAPCSLTSGDLQKRK